MLLKFKLTGAGDLDGLYEVERFPNTRELITYRKDAGLSPSELQEVLAEGGVEQLPLFAYVCHLRNGRKDLAAQVLDLPYDSWGGMEDVDDGKEEPEDEAADEDPLSEQSA
jgi:hypothetical protein